MKQFGRCQVCKENKKVTKIFYSSGGFLVTFNCGHQLHYDTITSFDTYNDKTKSFEKAKTEITQP
jgi:hypothetical protein